MLSVQNISYSADSHLLLDDVSIKISKGSFVGLIGPNGSGKSTLLKTIYRVNKASKGAVYLNSTDMSRRPAGKLPGRWRWLPRKIQ